MDQDKNNGTKANFPCNHFIAPIITALVVGGTAPWWVDFVRGNSSNAASEKNQGLEEVKPSGSINSQGPEQASNGNSLTAQAQAPIQQSNDSSLNLSTDRNNRVSAASNASVIPKEDNAVNAASNAPAIPKREDAVNIASDSPAIPRFEGTIGNYEASKPFTDFIFANQGNIVWLDAQSFEDLSRQPETGFEIDYFHLWDNCFQALDPNEKPWSGKCTGTGFSIDHSDPAKDAIVTWFREKITIRGYFAVKGCDGPHQGSMGCTLRPLNPEDVR